MSATDWELRITNNDNSKQFDFRGTKMDNPINQPVIPIPLVNTTPAHTFLFRFFGQTETINFPFVIYDDGQDVSDGDNIVTVSEQIDYLKNTIFGDNFDVDWNIKDARQRYIPLSGYSVVITALKFNEDAGPGTIVLGSMSLHRGNIGSV